MGTRFEGLSFTTVTDVNATQCLGVFPGAKRIFMNEGGNCVSVVLIPFGDGEFVYLGWDFYNAKPVGLQDGNWLKILDLAVTE